MRKLTALILGSCLALSISTISAEETTETTFTIPENQIIAQCGNGFVLASEDTVHNISGAEDIALMIGDRTSAYLANGVFKGMEVSAKEAYRGYDIIGIYEIYGSTINQIDFSGAFPFDVTLPAEITVDDEVAAFSSGGTVETIDDRLVTFSEGSVTFTVTGQGYYFVMKKVEDAAEETPAEEETFESVIQSNAADGSSVVFDISEEADVPESTANYLTIENQQNETGKTAGEKALEENPDYDFVTTLEIKEHGTIPTEAYPISITVNVPGITIDDQVIARHIKTDGKTEDVPASVADNDYVTVIIEHDGYSPFVIMKKPVNEEVKEDTEKESSTSKPASDSSGSKSQNNSGSAAEKYIEPVWENTPAILPATDCK